MLEHCKPECCKQAVNRLEQRMSQLCMLADYTLVRQFATNLGYRLCSSRSEANCKLVAQQGSC